MNVRVNVGGTISKFKYLVIRTPSSKEKSVPFSICCYTPSSLRGTKSVHTIIKFLSSFLLHFDSPKPQGSIWLCQAGHLWSQYCSAPDVWGRFYRKDRKDVFSSPFSPVNAQQSALQNQLQAWEKRGFPVSPRCDICGPLRNPIFGEESLWFFSFCLFS